MRCFLSIALLALLAGSASAQSPIVVRMATRTPDGSSAFLILKETAEAWKMASGGRVGLRLFPGGVAGDDPDVVRKLRAGTLDAALLTTVGLGEIDRSGYALGIPLAYDSYDEAYAVLERMQPRLMAALEAGGFVVLHWTDDGWVRFFTQKPVAAPDDLRPLKLLSWAGDAAGLQLWRSAGFQPVPLSFHEMVSALQSGAVQALGAPPQLALVSQAFTYARNMTDLRWQLLPGAAVVTKAAWEKIPADLRPPLLVAARAAGDRLRADVRAREAKDVEAMKKRGLVVVPVSAKQRAEWQKLTESMYPKVRGSIVPAEAFEEALRYRDEYRKSHPKR